MDGGVLLIETSESLTSAAEVGQILGSLGDLGTLAAVDAVLIARPPTTSQKIHRTASEQASARETQRVTVIEVVERYNPGAVVVVGVPFGRTRPQWIVPYGGRVTVDSESRRIWASYV